MLRLLGPWVQEKRATRAPTQFNLFMKKAVAEVKLEEPTMNPKEIFAKCAAKWKLSPENPKMGRVVLAISQSNQETSVQSASDDAASI